MLLTSAAFVHLKKSDFSKHTWNLSPASPSILLSGLAALPCSILSLDAMDISGEQHLDVKHDIVKKRLDKHGNVIEERQDGIGAPKIEKPLQRHGGRLEHNETYCGSCYGAEVMMIVATLVMKFVNYIERKVISDLYGLDDEYDPNSSSDDDDSDG
ncbi:hypothetical protein TEA_010905 [Camellia sinensis var. sinensis]|uniref:Uncharacterized protein n=1 Tax=Camellia sinensis var. sinensis TaxID=542762 RepID=A0A4S4E165_CAMSN|nr:hypothetical protein TEA_010905 [Camellia sinensis var. sinensis]